MLAHRKALATGALVRYNLTSVEFKSFTFPKDSQTQSIENAVLGHLPNRLLFTMVKNIEFLGTVNTRSYFFRHNDLSYFVLNVKGTQIHPDGLHLCMNHENTSIVGYRTLFDASGFHHSNPGLQTTLDIYIYGIIVLFFHFTSDRGASDVHISLSDNGNIRWNLNSDNS